MVAIGISSNRPNRGNLSQPLQYFRRPHIAGVNNEHRSFESFKSLRAQQAVSVRNDSKKRASHFRSYFGSDSASAPRGASEKSASVYKRNSSSRRSTRGGSAPFRSKLTSEFPRKMSCKQVLGQPR